MLIPATIPEADCEESVLSNTSDTQLNKEAEIVVKVYLPSRTPNGTVSFSKVLKDKESLSNNEQQEKEVVVICKTLTLPIECILQREDEMRTTAETFNISKDRWFSSLIYRKWNQTGELTIHINDPELESARNNFGSRFTRPTIGNDNCDIIVGAADCHSTTVINSGSNNASSTMYWWNEWITNLIETYYRKGTIRIGRECEGYDLLLAVEYFNIIYQPDQLIFDSYDAYVRVKQWSSYYASRRSMAQWVVQYVIPLYIVQCQFHQQQQLKGRCNGDATHIYMIGTKNHNASDSTVEEESLYLPDGTQLPILGEPLEVVTDTIESGRSKDNEEEKKENESVDKPTTKRYSTLRDFFNGHNVDEEIIDSNTNTKIGNKKGTTITIETARVMRNDFALFVQRFLLLDHPHCKVKWIPNMEFYVKRAKDLSPEQHEQQGTNVTTKRAVLVIEIVSKQKEETTEVSSTKEKLKNVDDSNTCQATIPVSNKNNVDLQPKVVSVNDEVETLLEEELLAGTTNKQNHLANEEIGGIGIVVGQSQTEQNDTDDQVKKKDLCQSSDKVETNEEHHKTICKVISDDGLDISSGILDDDDLFSFELPGIERALYNFPWNYTTKRKNTFLGINNDDTRPKNETKKTNAEQNDSVAVDPCPTNETKKTNIVQNDTVSFATCSKNEKDANKMNAVRKNNVAFAPVSECSSFGDYTMNLIKPPNILKPHAVTRYATKVNGDRKDEQPFEEKSKEIASHHTNDLQLKSSAILGTPGNDQSSIGTNKEETKNHNKDLQLENNGQVGNVDGSDAADCTPVATGNLVASPAAATAPDSGDKIETSESKVVSTPALASAPSIKQHNNNDEVKVASEPSIKRNNHNDEVKFIPTHDVLETATKESSKEPAPVTEIHAPAFDLRTIPSALTGPNYIDDDGNVRNVFDNDNENDTYIDAQAKRHEWIQEALLNRGIEERVQKLLKQQPGKDVDSTPDANSFNESVYTGNNNNGNTGATFGVRWDWFMGLGMCFEMPSAIRRTSSETIQGASCNHLSPRQYEYGKAYSPAVFDEDEQEEPLQQLDPLKSWVVNKYKSQIREEYEISKRLQRSSIEVTPIFGTGTFQETPYVSKKDKALQKRTSLESNGSGSFSGSSCKKDKPLQNETSMDSNGTGSFQDKALQNETSMDSNGTGSFQDKALQNETSMESNRTGSFQDSQYKNGTSIQKRTSVENIGTTSSINQRDTTTTSEHCNNNDSPKQKSQEQIVPEHPDNNEKQHEQQPSTPSTITSTSHNDPLESVDTYDSKKQTINDDTKHNKNDDLINIKKVLAFDTPTAETSSFLLPLSTTKKQKSSSPASASSSSSPSLLGGMLFRTNHKKNSSSSSSNNKKQQQRKTSSSTMSSSSSSHVRRSKNQLDDCTESTNARNIPSATNKNIFRIFKKRNEHESEF